MRIDPLLTTSPVTGAVRFVTDDLLREVYLTPAPTPLPLADVLAEMAAPWSDSFAAAPEETTLAVEAGLTDVMRATKTLTPDELRPDLLPEGRARTHLEALRALWQEIGALPVSLDVISHVLKRDGRDALEPLPLLDAATCPYSDPIEQALAKRLADQHGVAPQDTLEAWLSRQAPRDGKAPGALGNVQRVLGQSAAASVRDKTIALYGLRDPREEAEFAAALAQRMLDDGTVASPSEIGILSPDEPAYAPALSEAFERLGLPLSGQVAETARRDPVGELLLSLLAVFEGPAPRTALATVYSSPLMPWPREFGRQIARETIERGWSGTALDCDGPWRVILDALRSVTSSSEIIARLFAIDEALPEASLSARIGEIRGAMTDEINWPDLRRIAAPRPTDAAGHNRFVEGVTLFTEAATPWRPVRQLIALGLAGRQWPRMPGSNPFFTEGEIALIRETTGLGLRGRREQLARGVELFRRQLCAATDAATFLIPAKNLRGDRETPSTGLALVTHLLGAGEPKDLLTNIRATQVANWPVRSAIPTPPRNRGKTVLPSDGTLQLRSDLLRLRKDGEGAAVPQSPSRLETLLVSPFAWVLEELGARDRTWLPETLDVMTLGSLMHHVLEKAFPEKVPLPTSEEITTNVPSALSDGVRRFAAFLDSPGWSTERANLLREAQGIAASWVRFLQESGATIIHNEIDLSGVFGDLQIAGRADCLLKLPDDRILVVDHKRSSSRGRRDRMVKGWDLQVALYRAMLERPQEENALTLMIQSGSRPVSAYHTMLDGTVLVDADGVGVPAAEVVGTDISAYSMAHLSQTLAEVAAGTIQLNTAGDEKEFIKNRGITAYPLKDNALVTAFLVPDTAEQGEE